MLHHILNEKSGKFRCIYCGKRHRMSGWESEFTAHRHYKVITCFCGRKSSIRTADGSGHDNWSRLEKKLVEEKR